MKDFLLQTRVVVRTSNVKISLRRLADYVLKLYQKRAARAEQLLFLIQPIKSLIYGVDVAVAVVKSPYYVSLTECGTFGT